MQYTNVHNVLPMGEDSGRQDVTETGKGGRPMFIRAQPYRSVVSAWSASHQIGQWAEGPVDARKTCTGKGGRETFLQEHSSIIWNTGASGG